MISLSFGSREVDHKAIWSFEHRKSILAPLTSDAVTLSQQGDVGDRLIPKLRAVDTPGRTERFDSGAFDPNALIPSDGAVAPASLAATSPLPLDGIGLDDEAGSNTDTDEGPSVRDASAAAAAARDDVSAETAYERRQEIEQRAISSHEEAPADLGQTADLLDALRRRRGERESGRPEAAAEPLPRLHGAQNRPPAAPPEERLDVEEEFPGMRPSVAQLVPKRDPAATAPVASAAPANDSGGSKKRRASIPSWDDILFGTRSEDDPA